MLNYCSVLFQDSPAAPARSGPGIADAANESFLVDLSVTSQVPTEEPSLIDPVVNWHPSTKDGSSNESVEEFAILPGGSKRGKNLLIEIAGYSYNVIRR